MARPQAWRQAPRRAWDQVPLAFWMQTETHVYAMAISACVLLAFFPFLIVMLSLAQYVFKWKAAVEAIYFALNNSFPDQLGEYLQRNLRAVLWRRGPFQVVSLFLLLVTANGIFQPLEVALNRIWHCDINRSYLRNQLVGLGLVFACGGLILASTVLTALNNQYLVQAAGGHPAVASLLSLAAFKLAAIPMSMLMLFLIYWLLPNCRIEWRKILPAAIVVGLLLELLKYIGLVSWPFLHSRLYLEYGPFLYAMTLLLWGFLASMIVLAGAEWAARRSEGTTRDIQDFREVALVETEP